MLYLTGELRLKLTDVRSSVTGSTINSFLYFSRRIPQCILGNVDSLIHCGRTGSAGEVNVACALRAAAPLTSATRRANCLHSFTLCSYSDDTVNSL